MELNGWSSPHNCSPGQGVAPEAPAPAVITTTSWEPDVMIGADKAIRWSTAAAVIGVAAVAGAP